jgi:hypothetical protein
MHWFQVSISHAGPAKEKCADAADLLHASPCECWQVRIQRLIRLISIHSGCTIRASPTSPDWSLLGSNASPDDLVEWEDGLGLATMATIEDNIRGLRVSFVSGFASGPSLKHWDISSLCALQPDWNTASLRRPSVANWLESADFNTRTILQQTSHLLF